MELMVCWILWTGIVLMLIYGLISEAYSWYKLITDDIKERREN